jgi:parallel beta-helix repeat protein
LKRFVEVVKMQAPTILLLFLMSFSSSGGTMVRFAACPSLSAGKGSSYEHFSSGNVIWQGLWNTGDLAGLPVHNINTRLNYTTIQDAIDANETLEGHTILVDKGVYYEQVFCNKSLVLMGEDRENTIIDANGTGTVVELGINANITNFTIRNGEYGISLGQGGLTPKYTGNTITNNKIMDNLYGGVVLRSCANNTIVNIIVINNTLFGIHVWNSGENTIINNTVLFNEHGIDFYGDSNDNVLRNNNMTDNTYNFGLILHGDTTNFLYGLPQEPGIVNDVDASNTVNGKPIYYWVNRHDEEVPSDAGYVWLNNCNNITVKNLNLSENLQGILLLFANNTVVSDNNISRNAYGIHLATYCENITLSSNTLTHNLNGVYLGEFSRYTTMRDNCINGSQFSFGVPTWFPMRLDASDLINDVDASNTIDGKLIIYWIDKHGLKVPPNAGYVLLANSTDIIIEGLNLTNNVQNILLINSNNTVIANNSISNSVYGIEAQQLSYFDLNSNNIRIVFLPSFNTTIEGNTLFDNGVGIRTIEGNCTILNNSLNKNPLGICLRYTDNSTIAGNIILASNMSLTAGARNPDLYVFNYPQQYWELSYELVNLNIGGIIIGGSENAVYENTVKHSWVGIATVSESFVGGNNVIFHNNLIDNAPRQALSLRYNTWDNGYPSGGNFWSDYDGTDLYSGPYQNETGSDGIGDKPYVLLYEFPQIQGMDRYPLVKPYGHFNDIAVTSLTASKTIVGQSEKTLNISINVVNYGDQAETFNLTLCANATILNYLENISLEGRDSTTITFKWNLTTSVRDTWSISTSVTPVSNQIDTSDKTKDDLTIILTVLGDLNGDRMVNRDDAAILALSFGSKQNQQLWNPNADLNDDGVINILDAIILSNNFGKTA